MHYYSHLRKVRKIKKEETNIQNQIRKDISDIAVTFRANNYAFKIEDRYMKSGLPKGFPDLFGFRRSDKKFLVLEIKTKNGVQSKEQRELLKSFKAAGVIAGVARNSDEAREIILNEC